MIRSNRRRPGVVVAAMAAAAAIFALPVMSARAEEPKVVSGHVGTVPPAELAASRASAEMAQAATNLWNALTDEQHKVMGFEFADAERVNWHFIPRERKGLPWKQMTPAQQALGHAMLVSGLSQRGYAKAESIMSLEQVLADIEAGKGKFVRDPEQYFFSVFGKPGPDQTWGWRVEGHHLSFNFTIAKGAAAVGGPIFMGTNPAEVRSGPRQGLRVLANEEDLGFKLVLSLDAAQKKTTMLEGAAPNEMITGNQRTAQPGEAKGIAAADLKPEQQKVLHELVGLYAHRLRDELARADLAKIEQAGWDKVRFAWAGVTEPGAGHYYRIQGPTFLIEFDNTQNDANHIHTVWRDLTNDFGDDLLREHYDKDHKPAEKK